MCSHQAEWREEVKQHFEKIKSEGTCLHRLDEELINRRREELRSVFFFTFTQYQINATSRRWYFSYVSLHIRGHSVPFLDVIPLSAPWMK